MRILIVIVFYLCTNALMSQNVFPLTSVKLSTQEALQIHVKNELGEKSFLSTHMPKGKIYLVSVWATWCSSCRAELKAIQKVHCDWSEESDFEFIAVSIDIPTDHHKVFSLANKMDWNFKIIHEEYGYLTKELKIFNLPGMFLVDQKGNIVYEPQGYSASELKKLEAKIKAL